MPFKFIVSAALAVAAVSTVAIAQAPQPSTGNARTVIAATKLPSVTDGPIAFRALSITLPPGGRQTLSTEEGIVYQMSGTAEISVGSDAKTLDAGTGMLVAGGKVASLAQTGGEPSVSLYFELLPAAGGNDPIPANVKELFRTAAPIPGLKPGAYDLNMTRIVFPAQMASNPPHHRTGAALYYIISGTGANTIDGKTEMKEPGSFIYEPAGLVHQWGNPGAVPMTFLTFNINQEGMPAVAPDAPSREK